MLSRRAKQREKKRQRMREEGKEVYYYGYVLGAYNVSDPTARAAINSALRKKPAQEKEGRPCLSRLMN